MAMSLWLSKATVKQDKTIRIRHVILKMNTDRSNK